MPGTTSVKRLIKFGIVGGSGTLVNMGIMQLLIFGLHIDYRLAFIFAVECSIVNNFSWNYHWTWRDRKAISTTGMVKSFLRFNLSSGMVVFIINGGILVFLRETFHYFSIGMHVQLANLIGIVCGTLINFVMGHFWVFKKKVTGDSHGITETDEKT